MKLNVRRAAVSIFAAGSLLAGASGMALADPMSTQGSPLIVRQAIVDDPYVPNENESAAETPPMNDDQFLRSAIANHTTEIMAAQVAQQKATNPAIQQLASQLVQDRQDAIADAVQVAQDANVSAPQAPTSNEQRNFVTGLASLNGPDFDRQFLRSTILDHKADIETYQDAADNQDGAVAAYAQRQLPTLQAHLNAAEQVAAQAGIDTSGL